ncbi:4Fe-4S dicluster domain-containing protein [Paludibacterium purpuratum]|nr:4Fe-4S dicluster domain-containing protein [Paludibacterium purpuratum]
MSRFVFAEPTRCIGCNTCMAACAMVHKAEGLQAHPRLTVVRTGQLTAPVQCRHCEDAPCARVCPVNAITHENDAVVLNETLCIGCKLCAIACPFGAITPSGTPVTGVVPVSHLYQAPPAAAASQARGDSPAMLDPILDWQAGVKSVAVKCDLCAFSAHGAECVRVCPTRALKVVDSRLLAADVRAKQAGAGEALSAEVSLNRSREPK